MASMIWQLLIQLCQECEVGISKLAMMAGVALVLVYGQAQGAEFKVAISNFTFSPAETHVHVGDTVTFTNEDDIPHQVIASDVSFKGKALDTGDTSVFMFKSAGEFGYFCGLHPHMVGKVIVTP